MLSSRRVAVTTIWLPRVATSASGEIVSIASASSKSGEGVVELGNPADCANDGTAITANATADADARYLTNIIFLPIPAAAHVR